MPQDNNPSDRQPNDAQPNDRQPPSAQPADRQPSGSQPTNHHPTDKVTRKVILLYIAETLDSLTYQEFMETALESMYLDYFQFSQLLTELLNENLLAKAVRKNEETRTAQGHPTERYSLTPGGLAVLDTLRKQIPVPVTAYLHKALRKREQDLHNEHSIRAMWKVRPDGQYEVSFSLYEKQTRYFKCQITVPDEDSATTLCEHWDQAAPELYPQILALLWPKKQ